MTISPLALGAKKVIDAAWQTGPSYDLSSQAAFALESACLLQSPESAVEQERLRSQATDAMSDAELLRKQTEVLRSQVAELEAAAYGDATVRLLSPVEQIRHLHSCVAAQMNRADTLDRLCREKQARVAALAERLRAGQEWQRGRNPELVSENYVSQSELREIFGIPLVAPWGDGITRQIAPTQALREDQPTPKCRCDEPDADPYSCEADDCTGEFSELNPFGGGSGPVEGYDAKVSRTCGKCDYRTSVWHVADGSAEEELHRHTVRVHGGQPVAGA